MKKQQSGFTLIELVVVIVILGILAAVAVPRFVNLGKDAREAAIDGMVGGLRGAVNIVQARWLASGGTDSEVFLQGQSGAGSGVAVSSTTGLPTGAEEGIARALSGFDGFTPAYNVGGAGVAATFTLRTNCLVTYTAATGAVTHTKGGC